MPFHLPDPSMRDSKRVFGAFILVWDDLKWYDSLSIPS